MDNYFCKQLQHYDNNSDGDGGYRTICLIPVAAFDHEIHNNNDPTITLGLLSGIWRMPFD